MVKGGRVILVDWLGMGIPYINIELETTMEVDEADGRVAPKKIRVEMLYPTTSWSDIYHFSKL